MGIKRIRALSPPIRKILQLPPNNPGIPYRHRTFIRIRCRIGNNPFAT